MNVPDPDRKRAVVLSLLAMAIATSVALPGYHFLVRPTACEYTEVHPGVEVSVSHDESNRTLVFTHVAGGELNETNTNALVLEVHAEEGGSRGVAHSETVLAGDAFAFSPGDRLAVAADERWAAQDYTVQLVHVRGPILPWYCANRAPRRSVVGRETI